jgi:4-hydroxy-tetrahydrodipicolinate synthase
MQAATAQHLRLVPLFKAMFWETNPIPVKASLAMAGRIENELRLPLVPLSEAHRAPLAELLKGFGVEARP